MLFALGITMPYGAKPPFEDVNVKFGDGKRRASSCRATRRGAPGWKLRVLLAHALFADLDSLLLNESTNHINGVHRAAQHRPGEV